jgi:predicted XRE-type DNA-binding protein
MVKKRPSFQEFLKTALQDKEFAAEYKALEPEFELVRGFIKARIKAHITQKELANKLKLQQPAIARLERGGYAKTSIAKLTQVANALGYEFKFSLEPKRQR